MSLNPPHLRSHQAQGFSPGSHRALAGFTLLEIVLAMFIASLLLATLYSAMYVATRSKRVATLAVEPARSASIAAEMMTQDLQGVLPPNGNFRGAFKGTHQPAGAGSADMMEFYCIGQDETQGPNSPFAEGIRKVDLILRTDVQPPVLVRQ